MSAAIHAIASALIIEPMPRGIGRAVSFIMRSRRHQHLPSDNRERPR
jgi:hypothetical protein